MRHHARRPPPALSSCRAGLHPSTRSYLRALAKDPQERYGTCSAFAEVLAAAGDRWISSTLPTLPPPPPAQIGYTHMEVILPPLPGLPGERATAPTAQGSGGPPTATVAERTRPFHALVVDDSRVFRKFTLQATQLALFKVNKTLQVSVVGAASGQEAIERAAEQVPDLVLLDFDMPGLNGVDTAARRRGGAARAAAAPASSCSAD